MFFGRELYQMLRRYSSLPNFRIETFSTSAFGFLQSVPNYNAETGELKDVTRWKPYNVEAPFFWVFSHIERRRLERMSQSSFLSNLFAHQREKKYLPYLIKRR